MSEMVQLTTYKEPESSTLALATTITGGLKEKNLHRAPITKPIAESNVALVASGGAYTKGQVAFHWEDDTGVRLIPSREPATDVRVTHFAYDLEPAREDPNIVFPTDRLRELVEEKTIGSLATNSIACMGGIYSARRAEEELAPSILDSVSNMPGPPVDLVLLVPV